MSHLVEVAFKGNRKEFFLWDYPDPPPLNAAVIVGPGAFNPNWVFSTFSHDQPKPIAGTFAA